MTEPVAFKIVRYVLEVPSGAVEAVHSSGPGGLDFDEAALEVRLHTLRVEQLGQPSSGLNRR